MTKNYQSVSEQLNDTFKRSSGVVFMMFVAALILAISLSMMNQFVFSIYGSGQGDVGRLALQFNALQSDLRYLVYEGKAEELDANVEEIENLYQEVRRELFSLEKSMIQKQSIVIYQEIVEQVNQYEGIKTEIIRYEKEKGKYNSKKIFENENVQISQDLEERIGLLFELMSQKGKDFSTLATVFSMLIALFAFGIGVVIYRMATKRVQMTINQIGIPLAELTLASQEIAKGNLQIEIKKEGDYEIGILEESLGQTVVALRSYVSDISLKLKAIVSNDFTIQLDHDYAGDFAPIHDSLEQILDFLNDLFRQIEETSLEVNSGASYMANSALELAESTHRQKEAVDEISNKVEDLYRHTQSNEKLCEKADFLSKTAKVSAESGKIKMHNMVGSMETINESSKRVSAILHTINDIAEQTNLLALNSQIEAARAGIHGRSFAVVANEVSNLADRCAEAARESEKMIEATMKAVQSGNVEMEETVTTLNTTVENIEITAEVVHRILDATKDQQVAVEKVKEEIGKIADSVHQYAKNAEESAATSQQFSAQSDMLQELLRHMKLRK